ncbi:MAG: thioredoxin-disulfide reductase [Candidatus Omnitrophota bacterium]
MENKKQIYDIVIIGGGPAGLTAGLYAARARMETLLVESFSVMGQATMTEMIENYPGLERIGGFDFVDKLKKQAKAFGLKCVSGTVNKVYEAGRDKNMPVFTVETDKEKIESLSVIIATGASSYKLNVPGEKEFLGKGVSYCATCDGAFFKDKDIVVVGGGDTAVEEALFLTRFGKKVTIVHRRDRLRASKILQERAFANDKIDFMWKSVVQEIRGDNFVENIILENVENKKTITVSCSGVFIFAGWQPNTAFLEAPIDLDKKGCVIVDAGMATFAKGIFAAGDCCKKKLHQVVTACGDGATAAFSAQQYVEELKGIAYK